MRGVCIMIRNEIGALILRLIVGVIFIFHGLDKLQGGITETITQFKEYSIPYAEIAGYCVVGVELIGGIFLIIGFSIRFVSLLLIVLMIGAIMTVKFEQGFLNGYEFNIAIIGIALYLLLSGNRLLALDQLFNHKKKTSNRGKNKSRT